MRSELENCEPVDGHSKRTPAIRIHNLQVCDRCRLIGGHPWTFGEWPRQPEKCLHRGEWAGNLRPCSTCNNKAVKLKIFPCAVTPDGATVNDCKHCPKYRSA